MSQHGCGTDHQGEAIAQARCEYEQAVRAALLAHASALDQPPTPAEVADLWAHARGKRDVDVARAWVGQLLDLGWRPVVGARVAGIGARP